MIKGSNEHMDKIDGQLSSLTEIVAAHSAKLSSFTGVPNLENRVEVLERQLAAMDRALDLTRRAGLPPAELTPEGKVLAGVDTAAAPVPA
jgi:hypothetical protein